MNKIPVLPHPWLGGDVMKAFVPSGRARNLAERLLKIVSYIRRHEKLGYGTDIFNNFTK